MHTVAGFIKRNDIAIFYLFNRKLRCKMLNRLMRVTTELGSTISAVIIPLLLLVSGIEQLKNIGMRISAVLILSECIVHLTKRIVNRPRPYKILQQAIAVKPPACRYSFPSGHTCSAFSIAFVLAFSIPGICVFFYALALMVGISRIYLGFHYPTDVLAGFLISYFSFIIISFHIAPMFLM